MACLGHITLAVFALHIHVNGPDVHSFRIVAHDAFEHRSTIFRVSVLEFQHAVFGDHVDVLVFGEGLQGLCEDLLWFRELDILQDKLLLAFFLFMVNFYQEFHVVGPNVESVGVLFGQLLVNEFDILEFHGALVNVDQV